MPKLIIVSGEPRSGTSMMMQTLKLLGVPVWETDMERQSLKDPDRLAHANKLNPKGFLETPFVSRGINPTLLRRIEEMREQAEENESKDEASKQDITPKPNRPRLKIDPTLAEHDGNAVKIVTRGLLRTDLDIIDKIIMCARSPRAISYSQTELASQVMVASDEGKWEFITLNNDPSPYIIDMYQLLKGIDLIRDKMLIVKYEDMHQNAETSIQSVVSFLGLSPSTEQLQSAITNVDPSLNRKSDPPKLEGEKWDLAERLYNKLINLESIDEELEADIQAYLEKQRKKNVTWLEESIWNNCDISLYKKLQEDEKTRNILTKNAEKRHLRGLTCPSCKYFNRDGETYVIEREEIGDLVRNKINCGFLKKEVILEQCQAHWNRFRSNPDEAPPSEETPEKPETPTNPKRNPLRNTLAGKIQERAKAMQEINDGSDQ